VSYPDSVRYLYSLGNELKAGAKLGLERITALLAALNNPQQDRRFVHVAGTNGKGSTCAMIDSAMRAEGLRTGLYTSPHLISPTERIRLNGREISANLFAELFAIVHDKAEAMVERGELDAHPTYFETITAMAFLAFKDETDMAVIEVGLGGRLDATNVIHPDLCVITPIAFDHEAYLGRTLSAIAGEKAGILKPNVPTIVAQQHEEADAVIAARARELECNVFRTSDIEVTDLRLSPYGSSFFVNDYSFTCPLPGRHQVENARTAIAACTALGLGTAAIQAGIARARWPGRLQVVSHDPDFILDGAHNPAGAQALAAYINEFYSDRPVWLVYGTMRDKAIEEVTGQLFPLASKLILTTPDFPRAVRSDALLEIADHPNAVAASNVPAAIELAYQAPKEAAVFFTGSLFVVAEALALLRPHYQEDGLLQ
jgi:dihydrofolate synthase / folylpolyglutamate synthase